MILCYTGNGKGKTTAALGVALRASGHGLRTTILQFMKGTWTTGELKAIEALPKITIEQVGKGFFKILDDHFPEEEHRAAAEEALKKVQTVLHDGSCELLILDEINVAVDVGLLKETDVLKILRTAPPSLHIVLTGRNAPAGFLELADLVTEMKEIKHPFQKGIQAQKGIDF